MLSFFRDPRAVALLLAASLTILSNATISPALPGLEESFPDQPNAGLLTRLLVTAPALLVAVCAPLAGFTADRFGRKRQLLSGVALFAVAGAAPLVLPTLPLILVSRLVLGLAVAMVMTAQAALIGDYYSGEARGRFMGLQIAGVNFGGFAFIALAGWLAGISPRLPFAIYALGALYLPFLWLVLVEPDRSGRSGPAPAEDGGAPGWQLTLAAILFLSALTFIMFYLMPTQTPFYLAEIGYADPSAPARVMSLVVLAGGVSALVFGRLHSRLGRAGTPALGYALMAAGFAMLGVFHDLTVITLAAVLVGGGFGLIMPNFLTMALDIAPAHRRGMASGAITTSIFLGQFLSPVASQPLIGAFGYEATFSISAVVLGALAMLVLVGFSRAGPRARHA